MNITKLKQALEIVDCDGNVFAYDGGLKFCLNTQPSDDAYERLDELGFYEIEDENGFMCFT